MNDTMMIRNPETNEWEPVYLPPTGDTLPIGSIVDYDGDVVPTNYEKVDDPNQYSTEEKIIGTWIDGKPIYRKVINTITGDKISAWKTILSEVDKVFRYNGFVYETETDIKVLPYAGGLDGGSLIWFHVNATSHVFQEAHSDDMFKSKEMTIIVEYTKTTDGAETIEEVKI